MNIRLTGCLLILVQGFFDPLADIGWTFHLIRPGKIYSYMAYRIIAGRTELPDIEVVSVVDKQGGITTLYIFH